MNIENNWIKFTSPQNTTDECGICMEKLAGKQTYSHLNPNAPNADLHVFCAQCINEYKNTQKFHNHNVPCPNCRKSLCYPAVAYDPKTLMSQLKKLITTIKTFIIKIFNFIALAFTYTYEKIKGFWIHITTKDIDENFYYPRHSMHV